MRKFDSIQFSLDPNLLQLLFFLLREENKCPPEYLLSVDEKRLLDLAKLNKMIPWLFHLVDCSSCKKHMSKNFIENVRKYKMAAVTRKSYVDKELEETHNILKKNHLQVILLKNFSSFKRMRFHGKYLVARDIDVFVRKGFVSRLEEILKKKGYKFLHHYVYRIKPGKILFQEKHYFKPKSYTNIDIHFDGLVDPITHPTGFLSRDVLKNVERELLLNTGGKFYGVVKLSSEWQLLYLLIHFICQEKMRGLRNFYELVFFVKAYEDEIDWDYCMKIIQRFNLEKYAIFIFLAGERVFGIRFQKFMSLSNPGFLLVKVLSKLVRRVDFVMLHDLFDEKGKKEVSDNLKFKAYVEHDLDNFFYLFSDFEPKSLSVRIKLLSFIFYKLVNKFTFIVFDIFNSDILLNIERKSVKVK